MYHGHTITEEEAKALLEKGETPIINFQNRSGEEFSAQLKIVDGNIKLFFPEKILNNKCPVCGGNIKEVANGYACEHFFNKIEEEKCPVYIGKRICNRPITIEEIENFLGGKKEILDGFTTNGGKTFSSCLNIAQNGQVELKSEVCACPKCGGKIYIGIKGYNCSNYRNPTIKCDFVVWRNIAGRKISPEEVKTLCEKGATDILDGFTTRDGKIFSKQLVISETNKVTMI